jgi:hypothetical protein
MEFAFYHEYSHCIRYTARKINTLVNNNHVKCAYRVALLLLLFLSMLIARYCAITFSCALTLAADLDRRIVTHLTVRRLIIFVGMGELRALLQFVAERDKLFLRQESRPNAAK